MFAVRFHGRGGQGVVTATELLANEAFGEDRYAQAFPSFGSERMGAPVLSFCRRHGKARNARTDRAWHSGQLPFRRARRGGR
jgi:2-oxoacid:acceptor oxidoreductase gamma subunit (pyruvate/2-ketoisovalerate family)